MLPRNSPHHDCAAQMRTSSTPACVCVLRVPCTHKLRNIDAANDGVNAVYSVVGMSGMVEPAFVMLSSVSRRNSARTRSLSVEAVCSNILVTLLSMSTGPSIDSIRVRCDDGDWMPSTFWRRTIARRARFSWTYAQQVIKSYQQRYSVVQNKSSPVIWKQCITTPHSREWTRLLSKTHCRQIQSLDIHTTMPHASCMLHCASCPIPPPEKKTFYCWSGICPGPPGSAGTRKVKPRRLKPIWIYWSKR